MSAPQRIAVTQGAEQGERSIIGVEDEKDGSDLGAG